MRSMPGVERMLEKMPWMRECVKIQEELEWLKVREAGIEYSRVCKEDLANGLTWYSDVYLPPMLLSLSLNYMEDLDRRIENVLK